MAERIHLISKTQSPQELEELKRTNAYVEEDGKWVTNKNPHLPRYEYADQSSEVSKLLGKPYWRDSYGLHEEKSWEPSEKEYAIQIPTSIRLGNHLNAYVKTTNVDIGKKLYWKIKAKGNTNPLEGRELSRGEGIIGSLNTDSELKLIRREWEHLLGTFEIQFDLEHGEVEDTERISIELYTDSDYTNKVADTPQILVWGQDEEKNNYSGRYWVDEQNTRYYERRPFQYNDASYSKQSATAETFEELGLKEIRIDRRPDNSQFWSGTQQEDGSYLYITKNTERAKLESIDSEISYLNQHLSRTDHFILRELEDQQYKSPDWVKESRAFSQILQKGLNC